MTIAIAGNRKGIPKEIVHSTLDVLVQCCPLEIKVGDAEGVDRFVVRYYPTFFRYHYKIKVMNVSGERTTENLKKRNKRVVEGANVLICFIKRGRYHCGTFNTINWFTKMYPDRYFTIIDESGDSWEISELPDWLLRRNPKMISFDKILGKISSWKDVELV